MEPLSNTPEPRGTDPAVDASTSSASDPMTATSTSRPSSDSGEPTSTDSGAGETTTRVETSSDGDGDDDKPTKRHTPWWKETILLVGTALVLALLIKTFFVQAFFIPSGSMESTLNVNDRILVEKVSYWFGSPQRGDIIVFKDPADWLGEEGGSQPSNPLTKALSFIGLYPEGGHLVKRVVGVGGDHVRCHDGKVQVNGVNLDESSYVTLAPQACAGIWSVVVPANHLWVLGDNRDNSADSRAHMGDPGGGFVPVDDVVGKVFVTVWPPDRWRLFHRPSTFSNPALNTALGVVTTGGPLGAAFICLLPPLYRRARLTWGDPGLFDDDDEMDYDDQLTTTGPSPGDS
jgi:signal peptidase I